MDSAFRMLGVVENMLSWHSIYVGTLINKKIPKNILFLLIDITVLILSQNTFFESCVTFLLLSIKSKVLDFLVIATFAS